MTKNKNNSTPSNDGEILDSPTQTLTLTPTLENSQEEVTNPASTENEDVVSLDNNDSKNDSPISEIITSSNNTDKTNTNTITNSTRKYKVLLSSDVKFVLDLEEKGGYSTSHTTYTKSLNFKSGDFIEIPKEGN